MGEIFAVYRKEMRAYLVSPIPYIVTALFAGGMAWRFFFDPDKAFFVYDKAEMYRGFFFELEYFLIILVPVIAMGQWSNESNGGTIETLVTLPVRTSSLVAGKFLAGLTLILVCLLATGVIPVTVSNMGDLDWGPVHGGYFGAFLFCAALLALGIWVSSLTRYQIVSFVLTLFAGLVLVGMYDLANETGPLAPILEQLSLSSHYQAMGRGVIDLRDVLYFVSFAAFFLYLNVQTIENRRYR